MPVSGLRPVYTAEGGGSTSKSVAQKAATQKRTPVPKPVAKPPKGTVSKPTPITEPDYTKYINYFGSPEAYAKAIQEKEAAGVPLSDPQAAAAFKQAYLQLFSSSNPKAQAIEKRLQSAQAEPDEGSALTSVTYDTSDRKGDVTPTVAETMSSSGGKMPAMAGTIIKESEPLQPISLGPTQGTSSAVPAFPSVELPPAPKVEQPKTEQPKTPEPEKIPENVSTEGVAPAEKSKGTEAQIQGEELPKGLGGFMLQGDTLTPSPEVLYSYYKALTGREDENAYKQLQASYEGGAIPMWMASDPVWRAVFAKAGVNPRELRVNALKRRLGR